MSKQVFVANTILTAAQMNTLQTNDYNETVSTKTASYTLVAADAGTQVAMNNASATTITINTSLFTAGDSLTISNIGAGVCTVTAGTATVSSAGPLAVPQYGGGRLVFTSTSAAIYYPSAVTVAAPAASGLTFIAKTTMTAATQQNLLNVFSTTYDHYLVRFESLATASDSVINLRYGTAGTPDTGSNYANTGLYVDSSSTGTSEYRYNSSSSCIIGTSAIGISMFLEISSPFLAAKTTYGSIGSGRNNTQNFLAVFSGILNTTTSYTDLVLLSSVNITGVVSIYGYAKS